MASIKVKFRPSGVSGHEGSIYYQVIHQRRVRQFVSDYHVLRAEWDDRHARIVVDTHTPRRALLLAVREHIRRDVERLRRIDRRLYEREPDYTADDVVCEFRRYADEYSLFHYMENIIARLRQNKKLRTSETYRSALNSFKRFRDDEDVMLDALTADLMEGYESWLRSRGITPNTISFYTRILRAAYNRAVEEGVIEDRHPFRRVYTGIEKTVKRALPLALIRRIKSLDLSPMPQLDFARDMFLMSFYLRGMSFVDMAFLKKSDLRNGYVVYRRRKTGQQLIIAWTKEMQTILDKYPENKTDYLFSIIRLPGINEHSAYRNAGYNINRNLKKVADMAGIKTRLTMYVARHSWASAARTKGVPVSVISKGMGHDSETTTQIYLASLDSSVVDRANSKIIKSLK